MSKSEDKTCVYEDYRTRQYDTSITEILTGYCTRENKLKLLPLRGYMVFEEENKKTLERQYILYDNDGKIVERANDLIEMENKIDVLRFRRTHGIKAGTLW